MPLFGKRNPQNELEPPPIAAANPAAVEILRVWAAPGSPQQLVVRPVWKDPAAWGLMLVDIARHVTNAYEADGSDPRETLQRIKAAFDAEWSAATSVADDITPR